MWKPCFTRKSSSTGLGLPRRTGVTAAGAISTEGPPACAMATTAISATSNTASVTRLKLADSWLLTTLFSRHAAPTAECLFDPVLDVASAAQPEHPRHDFAIAINIETGGQIFQPAVLVAYRFLAQQHGIVNTHVLGEFGDGLFAGIVHSHAQHFQPLRPILLLQFHEPRHLQLAGLAPCGPEIQQHRLAAKIGQAHGLAVQRLQGKIRRRRTRLGTSSGYGT